MAPAGAYHHDGDLPHHPLSWPRAPCASLTAPMCIIFIAVEQHRRYPLIIAANRDEYHARPSEAMRYWPDQPGILAGRDGRAGGTWFGVNTRGRIAAVTNRRPAGPAGTGARSRGELPARFLRGSDTVEDYGEFLRAARRDFSPFNLIYGEPGQLYCFASAEAAGRRLESGFHSISNGALDDPWPKMSRGARLLKARIAGGREVRSGDLARMMKDRTRAAGADAARFSPIFVTGARYGTRTTTLLFGARGRFDLYEYNYAANGAESGRRHYSMRVHRAGSAMGHRPSKQGKPACG